MERSGVPRGKRPRVQVSLDDKERAIARIRNGETKAGISRELGVPESTVRGWVKRAEQRIARDSVEKNHDPASPTAAAAAATTATTTALQALTVVNKCNTDGQPVQLSTNTQPNGATHLTPISLPQLPVPMLPQTAESSENINGWLHIFNAGILNFTYIATAAYMQASARGTADRLSLWQIIHDYVEEAGRIVASNNGQYVEPTSHVPSPRTTRQSYRSSFVAPRLHITAEDDEDGSTGPELDN